MKYQYITKGTCSRAIEFEINDGIISNVHFDGGCNGNTQGICALIEGMPAAEVVRRLHGLHCGNKGTSCPDQLACAIDQVL